MYFVSLHTHLIIEIAFSVGNCISIFTQFNHSMPSKSKDNSTNILVKQVLKQSPLWVQSIHIIQ